MTAPLTAASDARGGAGGPKANPSSPRRIHGLGRVSLRTHEVAYKSFVGALLVCRIISCRRIA